MKATKYIFLQNQIHKNMEKTSNTNEKLKTTSAKLLSAMLLKVIDLHSNAFSKCDNDVTKCYTHTFL